MHSTLAQVSATEGMSSEQDLLRGDVRRLRTATGFVVGGVLSGAVWCVLGFLAWYLV